MATTVSPQPSGDGKFSIDLNIGIFGWSRGMQYRMQNPTFFRLALNQRDRRRSQEHNRLLQQKGDREARRICEEQWRSTGDSKEGFAIMYEGRAANKTFLAYVADSQGLSPQIQRAGNGPTTFTDHEKADVIEAIIGAVYLDCNGAARMMEDVLRRFGIYYPASNAEEAEIDRVWDLARRALAERVSAESEAKRVVNWWEKYRQWCWA